MMRSIAIIIRACNGEVSGRVGERERERVCVCVCVCESERVCVKGSKSSKRIRPWEWLSQCGKSLVNQKPGGNKQTKTRSKKISSAPRKRHTHTQTHTDTQTHTHTNRSWQAEHALLRNQLLRKVTVVLDVLVHARIKLDLVHRAQRSTTCVHV